MPLTPDAEVYAKRIAAETGLRLDVVQAWVGQESAWGSSPAGAYNYLNMRDPKGGWQQFASPTAAADAVVHQLRQAPQWYGGVIASAKGDASAQIAAIAASPWDAGHYGGNGGVNLLNAYNGQGTAHATAQPGAAGVATTQVAGAELKPAAQAPVKPVTHDDALRTAAETLAKALAPHLGVDATQATDALYNLGLTAKQNANAEFIPSAGPHDAFNQAVSNLMGGWQPQDEIAPQGGSQDASQQAASTQGAQSGSSGA